LVIREELSSAEELTRIEAYDISHLSGKETFGAMVVYSDGRVDKSQYRLFKIKSAPQNDDLRALEEVILRRFEHREWNFPDLILIDGGKPQIDFISKTLEKKHLNIPLVGISKFGGDKLVFPKKTKKSIKDLAENIKGILLKARNEAHRFCLKSSRRKRRVINHQ
jgi:excinuclease ABC subunit C